MSNPTELPGVIAKIKALTCAAHPAGYTAKEARMFNLGFYAGTGSAAEVARRAQPEGEAPQAEPVAYITTDKRMLVFAERVTGNDHGMTPLYAPATFSPLCGAQHAESGKEAKSAYEILLEVCRGGALALIELRSMVSDPEHVAFINRALANPQAFAAQLDGGQEGSESNG